MLKKSYFEELQEWFHSYVEGFLNDKESKNEIELKYRHSLRVYKNINRLAVEIGLSAEEIITANVIGLFHDLGRFEQYKRYRTFSDSDSIDHGQLSVKILQDKNLLNGLDNENKDIIYQSILNHNQLHIPQNTSGKVLLFSQLIRDADKLDIWNIFARRYHSNKDNNKINLDLSNQTGISPDIYQKVIKREPVKYSNLKTVDDFKVIQLGWVYDLNFPESIKILKERKYLEKIYQSMNQSEESKRLYGKILDYIDEKV